MTKLTESARAYIDKEYWNNPGRLYEATDPLMQRAYIAGAMWLLDQAKQYGYYEGEADTLAGWKSIYIADLEDLCQSKEDDHEIDKLRYACSNLKKLCQSEKE